MPSAGDAAAEVRLTKALRLLRTALEGEELTEDTARRAAEDYLGPYSQDERAEVVRRWVADRVDLEPVAVLDGQDGPRAWFGNYDTADGYHWNRLRSFLLDVKGRSEVALDSMDETTDRILALLEDPRLGGPTRFRVQGLVLGHVQSGKTANFSALAAKAFDLGYRLVIVLSGLHNSLRRQTQLRLETELGMIDDDPAGRRSVGKADDQHYITRMTNADNDFLAGTVDANILHSPGNRLLVMKKNATVLRRFLAWLDDQTAAGPTRKAIEVPVLLIDDEADQASINTKGNKPPVGQAPAPGQVTPEEVDLQEVTDLTAADIDPRSRRQDEADPSVINGLIRDVLDRAHRASYVGYTATPFANVLIDSAATDREVGVDLYPSDFIISLPRPHAYVGAERLFGRAALAGETGPVPALDVIRKVPDDQADVLRPKGAGPAAGLPASLRHALDDFVLAVAARDTRTAATPAASMLVHASHRTDDQDALGDALRDELATMRQQWRYPVQDPALGDPLRMRLQERWAAEQTRVTSSVRPEAVRPFEDLVEALDRLFKRPVPVLVLHNRSDDDLDYEREPDLRAVLVGGNKLSRGLTLEGLLVSYYIRRASNYDTLLQMGRWFGYREDYVDLTRLWTTTDLSDNFRDLATYEEELRQEIRLYEKLKLTPRDFGPRIRLHPAMQITAKNRMGSARQMTYSYSGTLQQTSAFHLSDDAWLEANLAATRELISGLGEPSGPTVPGRLRWSDVDWHTVVDFLNAYRTADASTRFVSDSVAGYIEEQAVQHGELTSWTVAVVSLQTPDEELGYVDLGVAGGGPVACISRSRERSSDTSIGTLVNPTSATGRGDEDLDLGDDDRKRAGQLVAETGLKFPVALRTTRPRQKGLLLLYPISRNSRARQVGDEREQNKQDLFRVPEEGRTVIGVAASFPRSDSATATREYVVGNVGSVHSRDDGS